MCYFPWLRATGCTSCAEIYFTYRFDPRVSTDLALAHAYLFRFTAEQLKTIRLDLSPLVSAAPPLPIAEQQSAGLVLNKSVNQSVTTMRRRRRR